MQTKNSTQPSLVSKFVVSARIGEDTKLLNKSNMASLAEQLRSLTNPEPSRFDLDEDEFDLTRAQVISKGSDLGDIKNQIESNVSNLRKKTVPLLQDEDKKYAGRKISRADLEASRGYIDGFDSEAENDAESDSEGMGGLVHVVELYCTVYDSQLLRLLVLELCKYRTRAKELVSISSPCFTL